MLDRSAIDVARLRSDLVEAAREARDLKRVLRASWTKPMADEQHALAELRRRTTALCILRALLRGRYHLAKAPREGRSPDSEWNREQYHHKIAERVARDYELLPPRVSASG